MYFFIYLFIYLQNNSYSFVQNGWNTDCQKCVGSELYKKIKIIIVFLWEEHVKIMIAKLKSASVSAAHYELSIKYSKYWSNKAIKRAINHKDA